MGTTRKQKLPRHLYWRGGIIYGWFWQPDPGDPRGRKQIKQSTGCTDPAAALEVLRGWERDAADPASAARRDATLNDAFELLLSDRRALVAADKRSPDSMPFYEFCARAWLLYAGRLIDHVPTERPDDELSKDEKAALVAKGRRAALRTVDRRFTDGFVEHRRRNARSEHTIAKNRTEMRAAMGLAKRAGIWTGDLDDLFPPGFESAYEPRRVFWTHQQAAKVLAQLTDVPHRRAQVCFVLASGAEKRAVHKALRADLSQVPLPLHGTKTRDRERSTPVLFAWQRSLLSYAKNHADGEDGLAFTEWKNSTRDLAIACKAARAPVVSMHGLRHVFGAWMLDEGLSEGIVAKALGHRDLRQLVLTYDTRDPDAIQRRAEEQMRRWKGQRGLRLIKGGKASEAQGATSRSKRPARAAGRR
jgi:integrase